MSVPRGLIQTYQVSRISRETPAFCSHLPLTCRLTKISRISSTKFGQLILSKTVKTVAIRCHILRLKFTKFHFGWGRLSAGAPPQTPLGELSTSPDPWLDLRGPTSKQGVLKYREGKGRTRMKREGSTLEGQDFFAQNICTKN